MAFINYLQTTRPDYWKLLKWVSLVFLGPLALLAIVPIIITAIVHVWRMFFFHPLPTTPTISIFGYIDLATIITSLLFIYTAYVLATNKRHSTPHKMISTTIPVVLFVGLMITKALTSETIPVPYGVYAKTNRIDAHLCTYFDLLSCSLPRVNCDQFERSPDGTTWLSSPDATLVYPDKPGSFGNNIIMGYGHSLPGPNGNINIFERLYRECLDKSKISTTITQEWWQHKNERPQSSPDPTSVVWSKSAAGSRGNARDTTERAK